MGSQIALGALDMKTFVALLALCVAAAVAQDPCGGTFGSNTYSLDNLNTGTGAGYEADAGIYKYTIGVCEALASVWQRRQQGAWCHKPDADLLGVQRRRWIGCGDDAGWRRQLQVVRQGQHGCS